MSAQSEFDFEAGPAPDGYSKWLTDRKVATRELARRLNLPLDHQVEVWLIDGVRLRGKLCLQEEMIFIWEDRIRHLGLQVDHRITRRICNRQFTVFVA